MTALHLVNVAAAIAALDIDGVTIYDLDQMPQAVDERACPVLGPSSHEPAYLTDWQTARISLQGNHTHTYTLNYKLFQAKIGKDRGLFAQYPVMAANAAAVADAFNALVRVDGCKRIELAGMPAFGNITDASGQQFHGATISLRVTEF
jgi:hypothetical protein